MKKYYRMILVGIISIVVILPTFLQGYNFNEGDIFDYELKTAKMNIVLETADANITGIQIDFRNIPEGNLFSYNISSIFSTGYLITMISGDIEEKRIFYDSDFVATIEMITMLPLAIAYSFYLDENWNFIYYSKGMPLYCHPFINVESETWSSVKEMLSTYETFFPSYFGENAIVEEFDSLITERRKINQIETFFKGSYMGDNDSAFNFAQSYKFAYSPQTGAILGSRFKGYFQGKIENRTINLEFEQYFEMLGFELEPFELGEFATENVSVNNIVQVVSSIFLISLMPIIFQKKKREKISNE